MHVKYLHINTEWGKKKKNLCLTCCNLSSLQVRKLISDFAIILTILLFCGVDAFVGVNTPKLIVPSEFKVHATH